MKQTNPSYLKIEEEKKKGEILHSVEDVCIQTLKSQKNEQEMRHAGI